MLGNSIRRRRGPGGSRRAPGSRGERSGRGLGRGLALGGGVVVVGFLLGYLFATRLLFPATDETVEEFVVAPDLRTRTLVEAQGVLSDSGLVLTRIDTLGHPRVPEGSVLSQSPLPGQLLVPGGSVQVTVSGGPELRPVPDVRRLRLQDARTVARSWGFQVAVDSTYAEEAPGRVVDVDPPPGTELALPSEIHLVVSRGPALVEMPLLLALDEAEAVARLDSVGLGVEEVERRAWVGSETGTVIGQEPAAGTLLERGRSVRLVVVAPPPRPRNNPPRGP